jgi:putative membrane protein
VLVVALVLACLAALLHVYVFWLESVRFVHPATMRVFGVRSAADAETMRPWAFNQGFYNLFLAVQTLVGVALVASGTVAVGTALVVAGVGSMLLAALVLVGSDRRRARAALTQGTVPALALLALLVHALL